MLDGILKFTEDNSNLLVLLSLTSLTLMFMGPNGRRKVLHALEPTLDRMHHVLVNYDTPACKRGFRAGITLPAVLIGAFYICSTFLLYCVGLFARASMSDLNNKAEEVLRLSVFSYMLVVVPAMLGFAAFNLRKQYDRSRRLTVVK